MKKKKVVKNRSTLYKIYNVTKSPKSTWNCPSDGAFPGFHSFTYKYKYTIRDKEHEGASTFSFYTMDTPGCCGALFAYSFNIPRVYDETNKYGEFKHQQRMIKFTTEFLHNMMNRLQRPITQAILTSADWQYAPLFKKAGWIFGRGVQSEKHYTTTGLFNEVSIKNILYPAHLPLKTKDRFPVVTNANEESEVLECSDEDRDMEDDYYDGGGNGNYDEPDYDDD